MLTLTDISRRLLASLDSTVSYKMDIYSNLDHMDTQLPSFIKGLQRALGPG